MSKWNVIITISMVHSPPFLKIAYLSCNHIWWIAYTKLDSFFTAPSSYQNLFLCCFMAFFFHLKQISVRDSVYPWGCGPGDQNKWMSRLGQVLKVVPIHSAGSSYQGNLDSSNDMWSYPLEVSRAKVIGRKPSKRTHTRGYNVIFLQSFENLQLCPFLPLLCSHVFL